MMAVACKDRCASCPKKQDEHEVEIQIEDLEYDFTTRTNDTTTIAERRYPLKQAKIRIRSITPPRCRNRRASSSSSSSSPTTSSSNISSNSTTPSSMHTPIRAASGPLTPGGQHHLWLPQDHQLKRVEPMYHLKVDVIKDNEWRGDCPTRKFVSSLPH